MNKKIRCASIFLSLLCCSSWLYSQVTQNGNLVDTPSRVQRHEVKTPKAFWVMSGLMSASMVFDAETTVSNIRDCGYVETESPLIYGQRPGRSRFYVGAVVYDGVISFSAYHMVRMDHDKWRIPKNVWRVAGWSLLGFQVSNHVRGGIHNYSIRRESR